MHIYRINNDRGGGHCDYLFSYYYCNLTIFGYINPGIHVILPFSTSADNIVPFLMLMWEAKPRSLTRLHPIQPESHLDVHLYIEVVSSENWIFDNILYGDEFICFSKSSEKLICYSCWKVKLVLAYFTHFYIYQTNSINQTISISIYCEMIILKLMLQICKFWLES